MSVQRHVPEPISRLWDTIRRQVAVGDGFTRN